MTTPETAPPAGAPRDGLVDRLEALAAAADLARGRVADSIIDEAHAIAERGLARRRLSSDHTVVAIAGATGSGKSSTFNALTGLELSAVGVRRPTTSWATACVWGAAGAGELLAWLGIPDRHQTTRDSMLDTRRESNELDGVVLLDLPDHDSTEVSHHLEVDRLVTHADVIVWVLDPQKYADAAIHDRYLEPLKTHSDVMIVLLNHIDEVPQERRESMLADVRRLLDEDGLPDVPVYGVAARLGWGMPELRTEIARRVAGKAAATARSEADIAAATAKLTGSGTRASTVDAESVESLTSGLAATVGIDALADATADAVSRRTVKATSWPFLAWRGHGKISVDAAQPADRSGVDTAVRTFADSVGTGLDKPWRQSLERKALDRRDAVAEQIDAALAGPAIGGAGVPGWARAVQVLQWLLLLGVLGGLALAAYWRWGGGTGSHPVMLPLAMAGGAFVAGLVIALFCLPPARRAGDARAAVLYERIRDAAAEVAHREVLEPARAELDDHAKFQDALTRARG